MITQEVIEYLYTLRDEEGNTERQKMLLMEAIYRIGITEELKKERDAALDTAYAALKMRDEH